MSNTEFDKQLDKALQELPEDLPPSRDLWRGIDKAINTQNIPLEPASNIRFPFLVSTLVAASLLLVAIFFFTPSKPHQAKLSEPVRLMVESFHQEKQLSLEQYQSVPVVLESMNQHLNELSVAERVILEALTHDPDNPVLTRMLAHIYKQQLEIIKKAHYVPEMSI